MALDISQNSSKLLGDIESICQSQGTAVEKSEQLNKWLNANKEELDRLDDSERDRCFEAINRHISAELKKLFDAMKSILKSLESDLEACYKSELTDDEYEKLQRRIYEAFEPLAAANLENKDRDKRSIYALTEVVQTIANPLIRIQERSLSTTGSIGAFLHDVGGKEMYGVQYMGDLSLHRQLLSAYSEVSERRIEDMKWREGLVRCSGIGMLKFLACIELLAWRLNPEVKLEEGTFDLKNLVEKTGYSQSVRFNHDCRMNLQCEVSAEEGTNTAITASEEMLYIIFMNILKNTGKIMAERKTPEIDQSVQIKMFEEENVLFVHYSDRIGGLDLTKLFQSAVVRVKEITRNKAGEVLLHPLQLIANGSFRAADELTMRDLCELIFLDRVYARNGGSGIGMAEAKDLMAKNGMYISTALNRENGTQFVLAFPRKPMDKKTIKDRVAKAEARLDKEENQKLNLPVAA